MKKLLWIASSLVAMSVMLSGCKVVGAACVDDFDCFSDEYCATDGYCYDRRDYEDCIDGLDCVDQQCIEVTTTAGTNGAFCTFGCVDDTSCRANNGFAGACFSPTAGDDFICFQTCTLDGDCEFGSGCIEVTRTDGFLDYICIPGG